MYEPNSWGTTDGGPRESKRHGFDTPREDISGDKLRVRSESFADHYSQARQFYISQTPLEQEHIASALVFELSKWEEERIRVRMVAHLRNIDEDLAKKVADRLGVEKMPKAADAMRPTRQDLKPSDALSIMKNQMKTFKGRRIGVLVSDGYDAALLGAIRDAAKAEGATVELVAPRIGTVKDSVGKTEAAQHNLDGGPSSIFDAVAVLVSEEGAKELAGKPQARDFVTDAFAHYKFIGHNKAAQALFDKAGVDPSDDGFVALGDAGVAKDFLSRCRSLAREIKDVY